MTSHLLDGVLSKRVNDGIDLLGIIVKAWNFNSQIRYCVTYYLSGFKSFRRSPLRCRSAALFSNEYKVDTYQGLEACRITRPFIQVPVASF